MGTLAQKLQYTLDSVDDIQKALEERGFGMSNVELMRYGDIIRSIKDSSSGGDSSSNNTCSEKLDHSYFVPNLCIFKKGIYLIRNSKGYYIVNNYNKISLFQNTNNENGYVIDTKVNVNNNTNFKANIRNTRNFKNYSLYSQDIAIGKDIVLDINTAEDYIQNTYQVNIPLSIKSNITQIDIKEE